MRFYLKVDKEGDGYFGTPAPLISAQYLVQIFKNLKQVELKGKLTNIYKSVIVFAKKNPRRI
jgi:hypothetical protein